MKHVLLIESKVLGALDIVTRARKGGAVRFSFLTSDVEIYRRAGFEFDRDSCHLASLIELPSTTDPDVVLPAVRELHRTDPIDAVMSLNDPHIGISSLVAQELGLRFANPGAVCLARDKSHFRQRLAERSVPQPNFTVVTSLAQWDSLRERISFPAVVKPVDGHASLLTTLVRNEKELMRAVQDVLDCEGFGRSAESRRACLVEQYLEGELISVEGWTTKDGHVSLGIVDRILGPGPSFMEIGGAFPILHERESEILGVWKDALDAIGWDFGPTHTELMVTSCGVKVIEVNGRLAGGPVPDLMTLSLGEDILELVVKMHLGEKVELPSRPRRACANLAFHSSTRGVITRLKASPLANEPFVGRYSLFKGVGDTVNALSNNFDRFGFVICVADTVSEAKRLVAQVHVSTEIEIVEGSLK